LGDNVNALSDYNPPPVNIDMDGFESNTTEFLTESKKKLYVLSFDTNITFTNYTDVNATFPTLPSNFSALSSYSVLVETFAWNVSFYDTLSSLTYLLVIFIVADYVYRSISSFIIIFKYYNMAAIGLPVIDVREFKHSKSQNVSYKCYRGLTHPGCMVCGCAFVGIFVIAALIGLYIPMYQSYQEGCVKNTKDGTMITRTAYSFAYNYAASDYNDDLVDGLRKYDQDRSGRCADYGSASASLQAQSEASMATATEQYDQILSQLVLFDACINGNSSEFPDAVTLGVTADAYPFSAGEIAMRLDCEIVGDYGYDANEFSNAVFDCSRLPICDMTCDGPDKAAMYAATKEAGCQSEWTVHSGLFRTALALLVYVCINVSRLVIMEALIRLAWRALTRRGFEFRATCDRMGVMNEKTQTKLKKQLDIEIRKFEKSAFGLLVLAILIHIPYIIILELYGSVQSKANAL